MIGTTADAEAAVARGSSSSSQDDGSIVSFDDATDEVETEADDEEGEVTETTKGEPTTGSSEGL